MRCILVAVGIISTTLLCFAGECSPPRVGAYRASGVVHRKVYQSPQFLLFDPDAYAYFTFYGAPSVSPAPTLGLDQFGRELKALPVAPVAVTPGGGGDLSRAQLKALAAQLAGGGNNASLESLTPSCASCHTRGKKTSGGFSLFDESGKILESADWKRVSEEIEGGNMPPKTSGKPAVSQADRDEIRRRAEGAK